MGLKFKYIPLTFLTDEEQIKYQIKNTIILRYLFDKYEKTCRLENLIVNTQYGYNASALKNGKNKFLRISDITDGKVDWESVPFCDCKDEDTYLLKTEDLLVARTGGTTGKSFMISNPPVNSVFAGYLIRMRANEQNNPEFINLFLNSYIYWSQVVSLNKGEFRPSVNATKLKNLILPDVDISIQNEAVRISNGEQIESYKELYNRIELTLSEYSKSKIIIDEVNNQFQYSDSLKQAILQEAIQGKLTQEWREQNSPPSEGWQTASDGVVKRNSKNYFSLPYNPKLKERAKALRKVGNLSEVLFWNEVKRKQFKGLDFDRQKIIGNYIVDFYCPNCNVVIEIDGSSHDDKQVYDAKRDAYLQSLGLTVIHIEDIDIKKKLSSTMAWLYEHKAFEDCGKKPPRPTDTSPKEGSWETASELLERIKAEKKQLIKDKKIRKQKPLPPITEEEIPFEIPESWVWSRVGEVGYTQTGTTPAKNDVTNYGNFIPFIQPSNITLKGLDFNCIQLSKKGLEKGRFIPKNSNLMVCIGGSAGKTCYNEVDVSCNQQINTLTALSETSHRYIDISFKSPHFYSSVWSSIKQGSTPILNKTEWSKILIPLPPIQEQKEIIEKVETLMLKCNALEQEITQSEQHANMLMQAVLKEAFEG